MSKATDKNPKWPGPGNPPGPQLINEVMYAWWEPEYRAGIQRMRTVGEMTWFEIGQYMGMDPKAAEEVYGLRDS